MATPVTLIKSSKFTNVDNTSDANKPVSTAQAAALAQKASQEAVASVEAVAVLGRASRLEGIDIAAAAVWSESTFLNTTGGTGSLSGWRTTNFISVIPGDVIEIAIAGKSPNIDMAGYNAAQVFVSPVLLVGGSPVDPNTGRQGTTRITIPAGVYFIRIGESTAKPLISARILTPFAVGYDASVSKPLETEAAFNLLGAKYRNVSGGTVALSDGVGTSASGYVPVSVGDTLVYHLNGRSNIGGVSLYDANRTLVRVLVGDTIKYGTEYSYTLDATTDASVAYAIGSTIDELSRAYFYVKNKASLSRKIVDLKSDIDARLLRRGGVTFAAAGSPLPVIGTGDQPSVTLSGSGSYLSLKKALQAPAGYGDGFFALRVRVDTLAGATAVLSFLLNPAGRSSGDTTVAVGDVVNVWAQAGSIYSYFRSMVSGTEVTILKSAFVEMAPATLASLTDAQVATLIAEDGFYDQRHSVSSRAFRSLEANKLRTRWDGKVGAYFGNSLQYMMWPYVAPIMGLAMTKIAPNGADAQSCLTDTNLALVPLDASLVTFSFGSGNNVPNAGYRAAPAIDSRDRATSEGAINFAIDWLTVNRPSAFIMFISPMYCGETGRDNTLWYNAQKALADYWKMPFADVWLNSDVSARNWSLYSYDNIHLTPEGIERQGGVVAGKLRSLSW